MKNRVGILTAVTAVTSLVMFASTALADDEPGRPIPEARQEKMLEQYGDEGIDANGDGVLTREEVRTFFAEILQQPKRL